MRKIYHYTTIDSLVMISNSTASDRVIVEALCAKYAQNAVIKPSELTDRVVLK